MLLVEPCGADSRRFGRVEFGFFSGRFGTGQADSGCRCFGIDEYVVDRSDDVGLN